MQATRHPSTRRTLSLYDRVHRLETVLIPVLSSWTSPTQADVRFFEAATTDPPTTWTAAEYTGLLTVSELVPIFADNAAVLESLLVTYPGGVAQVRFEFTEDLLNPDGFEIPAWWPSIRGATGQWIAPARITGN